MIQRHWSKYLLFIKIAAIYTLVFGESTKTIVPLFLFSGQSNMVGLGTNASQLSTDEKNTIETIKIYLETEGSGSKLKKWSTLGPGFGADNNQFGPELFFGRMLADSMPDTKIAFIKDAASGTYLGQPGGWLPPSSGGPGTLYGSMMNHIEAALKSFNDAFDTSEYTPRWAGFVWHQGEFDAWQDQSLAKKYEENLTNLINDIREMANDDSLPAIIPMIDASSMWPHNAIVREAEIAVAASLYNCDTMDTKGFPSDGIHYSTAGMKTIGTVCALRWLAMEYTKDWWKPDSIPTPVVYRSASSVVPAVSCSPSDGIFFDLSGKKVQSPHTISFVANQIMQPRSTMMLIGTIPSGSGKRYTSKIVNLRR